MASISSLFRLSGAGWRFLLFVFAASWIIPLSGALIQDKMVTPPPPTLFKPLGTRGPWLGAQLDDGAWVHGGGASQFTFAPGDTIVWEAGLEVVPGTEVSAEASLVCNGVTIFVQDFHIYANQRREGWKPLGLRIPIGTPLGDCGIRRQAEYTGANGKRESSRLNIIPVRIVP